MKNQKAPENSRLIRNLVVNKELQYVIILYSIVFAGIMSCASLYVSYLIYQTAPLERGNLTYLIPVLLILFLMLAAVAFGLFLTNRIAGPIRRLRDHILKINSGQEVGPVAFRQGDFFSELVEPLNELLEKYGLNKK